MYNVTGGGSYCADGNGVHINLSNSQPGVSYVLYHGSSVTGFIPGTGFALDFGLLTMAGVYTVQATNITSGCTQDMAGSATVIVTPLVTPVVSISANPTDSLCPGETVLLAPVTATGGAGPAFVWKVNGVIVGAGSTYSFVPANGDIASVTMTSNATCLALTTATASKTLTVLPSALPVAGVLVSPNDSVCQFNPITFTANPSYGGSSPAYAWRLNGALTGVAGPTYSFIPVDGDIVSMRMISNYRCRLRDTVNSDAISVSVDSLLLPQVAIFANPSLTVEAGKPITLTAVATHAGANPRYQWKKNGHPVPGATTDVYTSVFNDYDSLSCEVVSGGVCNNIGTSDWVFITITPTGIGHVNSGSDIRLAPNPNRGTFNIRGSIAGGGNVEVNAEVTNMLGQVVYSGFIGARNGKIDAQVQMDNTLANGMYILTLRTENEKMVFHFVMEQ